MAKWITRKRPVPPLGEPIGDWSRSRVTPDQFVRERLPELQRRYEADQNPMHAWNAYMIVREAGIAMPIWVLEYLDFVSENLLWVQSSILANVAAQKQHPRLRRRQGMGGKIAPAVSAAVGFVPGGAEATCIKYNWPDAEQASREKSGRFNPFRTSVGGPLELSYVDSVRTYLAFGKSLPEAKKAAAKLHKITVRRIEQAIQKHPLDNRADETK